MQWVIECKRTEGGEWIFTDKIARDALEHRLVLREELQIHGKYDDVFVEPAAA